MSAKSQVLVVDDESDIRELLGMTLARMGLDAHCARRTATTSASPTCACLTGTG
jgi:DNA-binding NtrC family response regulator